MLGRYEGNQAYGHVNFSETNYGFTDNYSGVWFPAGIDNPSNQTNIANYYLSNWSTELYVGEINDLINGGWVNNNEFNWCYIVSDVENLLYDQDSVMDYLYVKIRNAQGHMASALSDGKISSLPYEEWFKFYRTSVNESTQKILVEYATDSAYNFTESMYLSYDGGDYVSGSADGSTNWFIFSFTGTNPI